MKLRKVSAALILAAAGAAPGSWAGFDSASEVSPAPTEPPPTPPTDIAPPRGPEGPTEQLLGPIALYPDPLLALVLAASTSPRDVSDAAGYLIRYGDQTQIDGQRWDPSVRALAHYPSVLAWMAQNLEWTEAVGSAFLASPSDVMGAIQHLRARALAAGALASTPQQRIVVQDGVIQILPAEPESIFAPIYDPDVVYSQEPYYDYSGPFINFGSALPVGTWLSYCFDWGAPAIWVGAWGSWHGDGAWHAPHPGLNHQAPGNHPWQPPKSAPVPPRHGHHGDALPLPQPMVGAPNPPPAHYKSPSVQTFAQPPGVSTSARTLVVPMERPRLPDGTGVPAQPSTGTEPERRYVPGEGAPRNPGNAAVPANSPSAPNGEAPAPRTAPQRGEEPPPQSRSAPPPARESAPVPSHAAAPAPAPAPPPPASASGGESKNR
jgi:hypothetical protein